MSTYLVRAGIFFCRGYYVISGRRDVQFLDIDQYITDLELLTVEI